MRGKEEKGKSKSEKKKRKKKRVIIKKWLHVSCCLY